MQSTKVLLVNAPMLHIAAVDRAATSTHLQLIYSHLRANGVDVDVVDACADWGVPGGDVPGYMAKMVNRLAGIDFDVAGISSWTSYHYLGAMAVGKILRELQPTAPIAVGGWHCSAVPEDFTRHDSPFDWVVLGPGEKVMLDLSRNPRRAMVPTLMRGQRVPLDDIRIDWTYPYRRGTLMLSRGCPHSCAFCAEDPGNVEVMSVDRAVEEYYRAVPYREEGFLHVQDACFGINRTWRRDFLREISPLGSVVRLDVEARADQLDRVDIDLLAPHRPLMLFGLESASREMLGLMRKSPDPAQYLKKFLSVLADCDETGIEYAMSVLYNHPGERRETLRETVDFLWNLFWNGPSRGLREFRLHRYAYHPGSGLDARWSMLADRYGARIHHPRWWASPGAGGDHTVNATDNTASDGFQASEAEALVQRVRLANWLLSLRRKGQAQQAMALENEEMVC